MEAAEDSALEGTVYRRKLPTPLSATPDREMERFSESGRFYDSPGAAAGGSPYLRHPSPLLSSPLLLLPSSLPPLAAGRGPGDHSAIYQEKEAAGSSSLLGIVVKVGPVPVALTLTR